VPQPKPYTNAPYGGYGGYGPKETYGYKETYPTPYGKLTAALLPPPFAGLS
jgi:hypothetical protein